MGLFCITRAPKAVCGIFACSLLLAGCGDNSQSNGQVNSPAPVASPPQHPAAPEISQSGTQSRAAQSNAVIHTDPDGRKWIDDVPLDVFFDDPLAIAGQSDRVPESTVSLPPQSPEPSSPEPAPGAAAAEKDPGIIDWETLIATDSLENEVKSIRNQLGQNLQTLGNYNLTYLSIPLDASILAVLAKVAAVHPGDISWKAKSEQIQVLALKIASAAEGRGRKAFDAAKFPFESIEVILNGGSPVVTEELDGDVAFGEIAEMADLMKRIDRGSKWLKTNVASESALQEKPDDAAREASVLAVMAALLGDEYYGYAEDPEFLKMAHDLQDAGSQMAQAAKDKDFASYEAALSRAFNSCTACHSEYRQ